MSTDDQANPRGVQRNRPEHVDALASTVISVLRDRQGTSVDGVRYFVVDHLMRDILNKGEFSADGLLAELRGHRLTTDEVIDRYVPNAAQMLGELWVDDKIGFAEVTIGALRLQSLLAEATAASQIDTVPKAQNLHALVLVPQNEQHFLGASVVASQLRRIGCDVAMSFDEDLGSLKARLMLDVPDVVFITCSRRETLESVANTVQTIRAVSTEPLVAVGGALEMKQEDVIQLTAADIATSFVEEAVAYCAKRVRPHGSQ